MSCAGRGRRLASDADGRVGIRCGIRMWVGIIRCRRAGNVGIMGIGRLGMLSPKGDTELTTMRFEDVFSSRGLGRAPQEESLT